MLRRVLIEQRRYLVPLAIVLAVNVGVYAAVVYPLSARVADASGRAAAAEGARRAAQRELASAQAVATGKTRAEAELKTFYERILPASLSAANRATYLPLQQLVAKNNLQVVHYGARPSRVRDSVLSRLEISLAVQGGYQDIRRFIYDIETAPTFFVIDALELDQGPEPGKPLALRLSLSTYFRASDNAG